MYTNFIFLIIIFHSKFIIIIQAINMHIYVSYLSKCVLRFSNNILSTLGKCVHSVFTVECHPMNHIDENLNQSICTARNCTLSNGHWSLQDDDVTGAMTRRFLQKLSTNLLKSCTYVNFTTHYNPPVDNTLKT